MREIREIASSDVDGDSDDSSDGRQIFATSVNGAKLNYQKGARYEFEEFHLLKNGGTYILEPATERLDLRQILGDRWRRLKVAIEPLQHVESQKAIRVMQAGEVRGSFDNTLVVLALSLTMHRLEGQQKLVTLKELM